MTMKTNLTVPQFLGGRNILHRTPEWRMQWTAKEAWLTCFTPPMLTPAHLWALGAPQHADKGRPGSTDLPIRFKKQEGGVLIIMPQGKSTMGKKKPSLHIGTVQGTGPCWTAEGQRKHHLTGRHFSQDDTYKEKGGEQFWREKSLQLSDNCPPRRQGPAASSEQQPHRGADRAPSTAIRTRCFNT